MTDVMPVEQAVAPSAEHVTADAQFSQSDFVALFRETLFGPARPSKSCLDARDAFQSVRVRCLKSIHANDRPDPSIETALRDLSTHFITEDRTTAGVRVALMGRTMSGKSTLFEHLTGGDGSLMGSGGQRTTREPLERPALSIPGCVLVDTPGVGARDGCQDREIAFEAARECDLVLWVFANDSTQTETAEALIELADLGRPLILFMNCRERLDSEIRRRRFAVDPQRAYRDTEGHWARLFDILSAMGSAPRHRLVGHALAAHLGHQQGDASMVAASNVAALIEVLRYESSPVRASQWQMLRDADLLRNTMRDWSEVLRLQSRSDDSESRILSTQADEVDARLDRVLDSLAAAGVHALRERVDPVRGWYLKADLSGDLVRQWQDEVTRLRSEVSALFDQLDGDLIRAVQEEVDAFLDDWAVPTGAPGTKVKNENASGKANRLAKLVARVGPGAGGAAALLLLSNPGGWTIAGIGAAVLAANVVLERFAIKQGGLIDRWIPGRKKKSDLLRAKLGSQTREELAAFESEATKAWQDRVEQARSECRERSAEMREAAAGLSKRAASRAQAVDALTDGISDIDTELVRGLLNVVGSAGQAEMAHQVVRVPGVGSAVALDEPLRSELQILPSKDLCEPVIATRPLKSLTPWRAAAEVALGATLPPFRVDSARDCVFSVKAVSPDWTIEGVRRLAATVGGSEVTIHVEGVS